MSVVWAWLQAAASNLPAGIGAWRALIGAGFLAIGLLLLVALGVRRLARTRARRQPAVTAPQPHADFAPTPAVPTASPAASPASATTTRSEPASAVPGPRVALDDARWTRGEWHVSSSPLANPGSASLGAPSGPLAPVTPVAIAERPSVPLALDTTVALWAAPPGLPAPERTTLTPDAPSPSRDEHAEQEYRRGLELLSRTDGNRAEKLREALACFRRAQEVWTLDRAPERWAVVQNDIARVYQELPDGDRATNLRTAIMLHQAALDVFDPIQHAMNWAWTQSALGAAYLSLPTGSTIANARAAVAYYQRALDIFTRENASLAWAWNQNNLGAAYETMRGGAEGERVAHLRDAVHCYDAALEVYTSEEYPAQHQLVSRNLARVRAELKALE
jgi:tetratricopeptide (TPR) repeat protein